MSDTEILRCYLCALAKPCDQLVNLDEDKRRKTLLKLSRFCIAVHNLDSTNDDRVKTICILCIYSLDNAFDFVTRVEAAQSVFHSFTTNDDDNDKVISSEPAVKVEYDTNELPSWANENNLQENFNLSNLKQFVEVSPNESLKDSFNSFECKIEFPPSPDLYDSVIQEKNSKILQNSSVKSLACDKNICNIKKDSGSDPLSETSKQSSWKDYMWMCAYCDTLFPCLDEVRKHSMEIHSCCNVFRCIDCKSRKFHLDKFIQHVYTHRKDLSLSCYKCYKSFLSIKSLQYHKETHMTYKNKCDGCNETFKSLTDLTKHKDTYMKTYQLPLPSALQQLADNLTCLKCQKTYCNRSYLKQHLFRHLDRRRDYMCDKCGKCFITKAQTAEHMISHEEFKRHQCFICKQYFRTLSYLHKHFGVHDAQKPFACDQCGKRFRLQRYLNSHMVVHSDSRPWICTVCNKAFRFRATLHYHIRQHTGEKPYSCKICEKSLANLRNYRKHLKTRHGLGFGINNGRDK